MKRLINENIENAAEWLKSKKELEAKLNELKKSCEHWVVYDSKTFLDDNNNIVYDDCLICDFCNKVIYKNNENTDKMYNKLFEKQKKIFDYKYRIES